LYRWICPLWDILYPCRTEIHVVKCMFETLMSNLWVIAPTLWVSFIVYALWYSARAKDYAPITSTEAKQLWVIHQQGSHCTSKKWRQVRKRDVTVGFECGCGYKYMQQRPLVGHLPSSGVQLQADAFNAAEPRNRNS
jgi:hypothetical protein